MTDIAFHITDLAANSLRAGADAIDIALSLDGTQLELAVTDNGCGMAPEAVRRAFDPFYTTRTTRRTGLGLPFLLQSAEGCGGSAAIRSVPGKGTCVRALFMTDHPDSPPAGDLAETLMQIMAGNPGTAFTLTLRCGTKAAGLSTTELSDALGSVPLRLPPSRYATPSPHSSSGFSGTADTAYNIGRFSAERLRIVRFPPIFITTFCYFRGKILCYSHNK